MLHKRVWENLSDEWLKKNVSGDAEYALHHYESYICENGVIAKEKKAAATKKRNITKQKKGSRRRTSTVKKQSKRTT